MPAVRRLVDFAMPLTSKAPRTCRVTGIVVGHDDTLLWSRTDQDTDVSGVFNDAACFVVRTSRSTGRCHASRLLAAIFKYALAGGAGLST